MPLLMTQGSAGVRGYGESLKSGAAVYIEDVFSTYLYTGDGTTQAISNGIDLSGKGGLVWNKQRNGTFTHCLTDTARGVGNSLDSADTAANDYSLTRISAFNADGFTMGGNSRTNANGSTYVSWTFRKQAKFFDVVTYTGNGTNGRSVPHSLGSVPGMIIVKRTDTTGAWCVYHRSAGGDLFLNTTAAQTGTLTNIPFATSTTFDVGVSSGSDANASGGTYVAYLFAHDAGGFGAAGTDNVISCGSFTKSAGVEATITLGYEPQWLLFKRTDAVENWFMIDNMRGMTVGGTDAYLIPNLTSAESNLDFVTPAATGFIATNNFNTGTYIYIAIRRGPMKTPTSGTSVFSPMFSSTLTGKQTTGFPIDLQLSRKTNVTYSDSLIAIDRLRLITTTAQSSPNALARKLITSSTAAESTATNLSSGWDNTGFIVTSEYGGSGDSPVFWNFRRAPGFFDVVCYTGTGAARNLNHNLGVTPELMIIKNRGAVAQWAVYHSALGATKAIYLNGNGTPVTATSFFNDTAPTSSLFTVNFSSATGDASTYVAYLFATVAGVSKVGSYTGTGTTKQIDCGFTGGARFVLIKRTDSTGDWYVWDSARGIVAGNDPYLLLNSTTAEVTNTDYIDTYAAGFELSSTAPAAINANGGTYIFLAIA